MVYQTLYLSNHLTVHAEILCAVRETLTIRLHKSRVGNTCLHVHTCNCTLLAAYFQNRQGGITLRAPVRKGATDAHRAAGRLQEKSDGVLAGGTLMNELRALE